MSMLRSSDQDWLFMETAQAVSRGRPLPEALEELGGAGGRRGKVARRLAEAMRRGRSLSAAADETGVFMLGVPQAIEAGERSGRLAEVLRALSDHARTQQTLHYNIAHAILYPLVIAFAALAMMLFLNAWVLPQFTAFEQGIIEALDVTVPFRIGWKNPFFLFFEIEAVVSLLLPASLLVLLYLMPLRRLPGHGWLDLVRMKVPLIGRVIHRQHVARWCGTAGMLFEAGVAEPAAVQLAGDSSGNARVQKASRNVQAQIIRGVKLGEAMQQERFFPDELNWMVTASAKSGSHRQVWPIAQGLYQRQAEDYGYVASFFLRLIFAILAFQAVGVTAVIMLSPLLILFRMFTGTYGLGGW
ncbi:MAG: type II secretion system F family protein [Candidatus Brocadiia bacterium]|jgi:type II secretory pathway component PulF